MFVLNGEPQDAVFDFATLCWNTAFIYGIPKMPGGFSYRRTLKQKIINLKPILDNKERLKEQEGMKMLISYSEFKIIEAFRQEPNLMLAALEFILNDANPPQSLPDDLRPRETKYE